MSLCCSRPGIGSFTRSRKPQGILLILMKPALYVKAHWCEAMQFRRVKANADVSELQEEGDHQVQGEADGQAGGAPRQRGMVPGTSSRSRRHPRRFVHAGRKMLEGGQDGGRQYAMRGEHACRTRRTEPWRAVPAQPLATRTDMDVHENNIQPELGAMLGITATAFADEQTSRTHRGEARQRRRG